MKNLLACILLLYSLFLMNSTYLIANTCDLKFSPDNRFLVHDDGTPFFPNGDTAWEASFDLDRGEVETYLQTRKNQKFNIFGMDSFDGEPDRTLANPYGDQPFVIVGGDYDPTQPITTPGNNPNNAAEYDYWDHLEYIIDNAASKGIYVVLLPCWGNTRVIGSQRIFTSDSIAYTYGQWIGNRFSGKTNIIWMMGGDGIPDQYTDYKPRFRKMAEGVADGVNGVNNNDGNADYSTTLMSYHGPKWSHSSSYWFPNDAFMDFNSTQDQPSDQINRIQSDYNLSPVKATWLFEGGYEERVKSSGTYTDWQCRFQAYQTVFPGGFGNMYGHMSIWEFKSDWVTKLQAPGAKDMQHLLTLMTSVTDTQFLNRIPGQALIDGDTGSMSGSEGMFSTCIVATHTSNGDNAMIYSANGRNIRVKMNRLAGMAMSARWFNPRSGAWTDIATNISSGTGAPIVEFDPPGSAANGNDYVLVLDTEGVPIPPEPVVIPPYVDNVYTRGLLHCDAVVTNLWPDGADNCFITPDDNSSGRPAVSPILNASNDWTIGMDNSTMPTFKTNSPYSGDYLAFDGDDSIIVTNAWLGGDSMTIDLGFRFNGLPPLSGDNYMGVFITYPIKTYIQNIDNVHGKILMIVYDADVNPHFFSSTKVLSPNVWYHLSFSLSNNNVQVVVGNEDDGYTTDTTTVPSLLQPAITDIIIGDSYFVPSRLFKGDMDEIRWGFVIPEPTTVFFIVLICFGLISRKKSE